jgi:RND family efflux transporter MFP subunit
MRQVNDAQELLELKLTSSVLSELRSQLKQAQDELVKAGQTLSRGTGQDVFGDQFIPVKDFWTLRAAQLDMIKAESALAQAKDNRDKAKLALEKAKNDQNKANLTLDKARIELDSARDELDKAIIHAPFNGTIAKAEAKPGEALSSQNYATSTIIEIADPKRMELEVEIDEVDIPEVKLGQRVIISVDALPDMAIEGEVVFVPPMSREEPGLVLYDVKIALDAPQNLGLRGGMRATADIVISEQSGVLLVPNEAITLDSQGNPVVTVIVNEQGQERAVVTGISNGSGIEVLKGLNEGDMVVVERLD